MKMRLLDKIEDFYLNYTNRNNSEYRMYLKNEYGIRNKVDKKPYDY